MNWKWSGSFLGTIHALTDVRVEARPFLVKFEKETGNREQRQSIGYAIIFRRHEVETLRPGLNPHPSNGSKPAPRMVANIAEE